MTIFFLTIQFCRAVQIPLPAINTNNIIVVTNAPYNAVGDGITTNTTAIQNAINAAAAGGAVNGLSGGTVEIPPGIFLCGPLTLKSFVNLQIDSGAILRMLPYDKYPGGIVNPANFISASSLHDIEISGSGAIDGQGAPWWPGYKTNSRPIMIRFSDCNRQLIQNVMLSNSPMFHISISGSKSANTTVRGVTIRAPASSDPVNPSHNTDACDVDGTNILVENCNISVGDDDFTCGGGTSGVLLTNNTYGNGHGISIGSYTDGGVSNITVVNCTINGADNGIRIKSDDGRGGLVQNISYSNIGMTNVGFPIQIYAYYNEVGTPSSITPNVAAGETVAAVSSSTPIYRNITFSNITATSVNGRPIGIIWARTELPATNIIFDRVNIAGDRSFDLYNVHGAQFIDCDFKTSSGTPEFELFNAQAVITNSAPTNTLFTLDGLTTNSYGNTLAFFNAQAALKNTNALGSAALTLGASIFTVSNNLALLPASVLNFQLGTNATKIVVTGNLALGGVNNIIAGNGFTSGIYPLFTYVGNLSGSLPTLGSAPVGYDCAIDTNADGQVNLIVTSPPEIPTNLTAQGTNLMINLQWLASANAASYNVKRSATNGGTYRIIANVTATNYSDTSVSPGTTYYYVVSATNSAGESANSSQVSAAPLPSSIPTNMSFQISGNQLRLSWPSDHLGWHLQAQTNNLASGLGTNWSDVTGADLTNQISIPINSTNGSVFFRMIYP